MEESIENTLKKYEIEEDEEETDDREEYIDDLDKDNEAKLYSNKTSHFRVKFAV